MKGVDASKAFFIVIVESDRGRERDIKMGANEEQNVEAAKCG